MALLTADVFNFFRGFNGPLPRVGHVQNRLLQSAYFMLQGIYQPGFDMALGAFNLGMGSNLPGQIFRRHGLVAAGTEGRLVGEVQHNHRAKTTYNQETANQNKEFQFTLRSRQVKPP